MRLVVAECSIDYIGRVHAHLPLARRLIVVKADGTVIVHADAGGKPLNWMSAPCRIEERPDSWVVTGSNGDRLDIAFETVLRDETIELGAEPGLQKSGSEAELQALIEATPESVVPGARLIAREFPTDLGPVDFLLRGPDGSTLVVEVKRVAEIAAVEQLTRYVQRLRRDPTLTPVRGVLAANTIKPQARTLAAAREIDCVEIDFDALAGRKEAEQTLF